MDTEVRIRKAEASDVPKIVGLSSALFREDAGKRDTSVNLGWPDEEGREYFADLLSCPGSLCLLAESSGWVVGYLAGHVRGASSLRSVEVAELESMYVREAYRGRGVGAGLVRELLRWAESRGVERASVTAYAANERAIRFYEGLGFRPKSLTLEAGIA